MPRGHVGQVGHLDDQARTEGHCHAADRLAVWVAPQPLAQRVEHEQDALRQGQVAVNSILRDWIKGQVTAVECGILSFEAVFMPYMLTHDGRPLIERVADLLPQPDEQKVVALPAR